MAAALGLTTTTPARAASLSAQITGYTTATVPGYVSMFEYVPAKLAANPPILVVSHFCGGTAAAVFGEAQGGGIVSAADQFGFLMIFPQTSNNCWDVATKPSLTHDGGGDTQAIAEMVKYEISKRGADPNRVYATGTSSGAMMTEALLAVYPEVFKAGAEFSGVPAGCWSVSDPNGQWSVPCATGMVSNTAQQWGDMVRAMEPGYSGYRPRIQLWHGTADATINFNNQTEAIKEWTNVLGVGATPTSTGSVTLNGHSWTRQSWQDSCGFIVLDAWSEQNGPHGTDANLNATYVIPFLGLDKTGPDPQVAACGDAGPSPGGSSSGAADAGARDAGRGPSSSSGSSSSSSSGGQAGSSSSSGGSGGSGAGSSSSGGSGAAGSGSSGSAGNSSSSGGSGSGGPSGGSSGGSGGAGGGSTASGGDADVGGSGGDSASSGGGGCSFSPMEDRTGSGALAAMTVLGIVVGGRRRRRPYQGPIDARAARSSG